MVRDHRGREWSVATKDCPNFLRQVLSTLGQSKNPEIHYFQKLPNKNFKVLLKRFLLLEYETKSRGGGGCLPAKIFPHPPDTMLSARMNEGGGSVHPAPTKGDCAKTQLDYIAEDVIKRFFSLDNSRALGVQTWILPLLLVQPELRMQRVFYAAEVISLTAGLFLFFCQGLARFKPGMTDLGFISAVLASVGCIVIITTIIMVLLVALFNSVKPASPTATVIGAAQPLGFCAFWFFTAIHFVYIAFALHVVDTCGGAMGLALGILSIKEIPNRRCND